MKRIRIRAIWDHLRSSYWFLPSVITVAAVIAAYALTRLDQNLVGLEWEFLRWIDAGQPESARALLTTVAGSMISVATLTFSVTIVTLTLATSSFGSRIVYSFMRDRSNQFVLGVFVGTFVYCLLVLRAVRSANDETFVPHLSVAFALVLAVLSIGVLIYFIHHVAEAIQANHVIANVSRELRELITDYLPEEPAPWNDEPVDQSPFDREVIIDRGGTLQAIDTDRLAEIGQRANASFCLIHRAGDHLLEGTPIARYRAERELDDSTLDQIRSTIVIGGRRTLVQDIELGFHQLVEIGVRALSPGVNDPFTAISCIDELGAGVAHVMSRGAPDRDVYDSSGTLRVIRDEPTFEGVARSSFTQIRQHGASDLAVSIRLLETITRLAPLCRWTHQARVLREQADLVHEAWKDRNLIDADRRDFEERYESCRLAWDRQTFNDE